MDENKSELSYHERNTQGGCEELVPNVVLQTQFPEDENIPVNSNMKINNEHNATVQRQNNVSEENTIQTEINPALLEENSKNKENSISSDNVSVNLKPVLKTCASVNDCTRKYQEDFTSINDTNLPQELLQESATRNISLSLPALSTCLDLNTQELIETKTKNVNRGLTISDNLIDTYSAHDTQMSETNPMKGNLKNVEEDRCDITQISSNRSLTKINKNVIVHTAEDRIKENTSTCAEKKQFNMGMKTSTNSIQHTRALDNCITRPTLADDSKLVKLSLPTNPINIMQSNTQFLNKSRNFLNFITEKSTNIMEKALLPQHLAIKYSPIVKSADVSSLAEKKPLDGHCASTEPPGMFRSNSQSASIIKGLYTQGSKNQESSQSLNASCHVHTAQLESNNICRETKVCNSQNLSPTDTVDTSSVKNIEGVSLLSTVTKSSSVMDDILPELKIQSNKHSSNENINSMLENDVGDITESLEISDNALLQHPAYLALLKNYMNLKTCNVKLSERVTDLERQKKALGNGENGQIFAIQIENLEKTVDRLMNELDAAVKSQEILKREYASANRERESMVMKYAVSEKQVIDTQRARDYAERKVKEVMKDQELLQTKLRQAQGERTRICNILDGKCREVADLQKEVERLKEEVNIREVKLKWTQNKLKTEMEAQKETQLKLDKASVKINEMKEECEHVRRESQESIRKFQQSEENKAVTLDQQLKEQQARLILERHVTEDKEMLRLQLQKEVEVLKNRQQTLIEENNALSLKIQDAEKNRLNYESNLSNLRTVAEQRQKEIVDLLGKVSDLETIKLQLQHKQQCLTSVETEIENLRLANEELRSDMNICRQREAEMLDFTQKLTEKNVRLQSEFTAIEAKVRQLENERKMLLEHINELNGRIKPLEENLETERKKRIEECEILAKHLAEQTQLAQKLAQKLEDSQGENAVLRRKQQITTKELSRELQQCRKKLEAFEAASPSNSLGVISRTGSNTSLNAGDTLNGALSDNSANGDHTISSLEPSRQALIDRIIELQQTNVRRAEKLDFLEEHTKTLLEELQKKKKIIQNYILHENFGAMGSDERDRHKAELAKHGGIMASVYTQRISDDNMTLELSLEINRKLQAALEDTLFKNITLKNNIDTLGEEIARLTMKNRQKQIAN